MDITASNKASPMSSAMIPDIVETFRSRLISYLPFDAKVGALSIKIESASKGLSTGTYKCVGNKFFIKLRINEADGPDYVAYTIARQLAHLLFSRILDSIGFAGKTIDGSIPVTNIMRTMPSETTIWGIEFQEQCANMCAQNIIEKIGFEPSNSLITSELERTRYHFLFSEAFVNSFGASLSDLDKFDQYSLEGNIITPSNLFWYCVVNHCPSILVNGFDAKHGIGSYHKILEIIANISEESTTDADLSKFKLLL